METVSDEPFDLRAYLDGLAAAYDPRPRPLIVSQRVATFLAEMDLVEGRDFVVATPPAGRQP
jgi:hypothetical protein